MKKILTLALIAALSLTFNNGAAQDARQTQKDAKVQQKTLQKHDKELEGQIKEKAVREARQKAKQLKKQGFAEFVGSLPVDKQLEQSWKYIYDRDQKGYPVYLTANQTAIGGSVAAAKTQASALAKVDIAGQIETQVAALLESQVSNQELGAQEAATIVKTVSANKLKIQQTLGRTIPMLEVYRKLSNGNYEVQLMLGYNTQEAFSVVKKVVKESLAAQGDKLAEQVDKLL